MNRKYIKIQVLMACRATHWKTRKNIYNQLEETIAERNRILPQWEKLFLPEESRDIYALLEETIAERKRTLKEWEKLFPPQQTIDFKIMEKNAA
jgi:hypothetical protein